MIIRDAIEADMGAVLAMAEAFCALAGEPFDAAHTVANIAGIRHAGFLLVALEDDEPVGMLAAVASPGLCSPEPVMHEVCMWVVPERRSTGAMLRMVREFDRRAEASGARGSQLSTLANSPEGLAGVYHRLGYAPNGSSFYKAFGGS